jgi:hypothetical protein
MMNLGDCPPRVLMISTNRWPMVGRLASSLSVAGFRVAVLCPKNNPANKITKVEAHYSYRPWTPLISIKSAIAAWSPDILVCTDDSAVHKLHSLYFNEACKLCKNFALLNLIEVSLCSHIHFQKVRSKSDILLLARSLGLHCPRTIILSRDIISGRELDDIVYPILVKADTSFGGQGVRFVKNRQELIFAVSELSLPDIFPSPLRRWLARRFGVALSVRKGSIPFGISIQDYVEGRPANCAVVCWQGEVLSGITVDVLATSHLFGPATIGKVIDHPEIMFVAKTIVRALNLSGFVGFDFIIDCMGKAWFLEMNLRATQTSHLCWGDHDLAGSFFTAITGAPPKGVNRIMGGNIFRLFPAKPDLPDPATNIVWDDICEDEPAYLNACLVQQHESLFRRIAKTSARSMALRHFAKSKVRNDVKNFLRD